MILGEAERQGKEAVGALRFETVTLDPGEKKEYVLMIGVAAGRDEALNDFKKFSSTDAFNQALVDNQKFWSAKTSSVLFENADKAFTSWMRWVWLRSRQSATRRMAASFDTAIRPSRSSSANPS